MNVCNVANEDRRPVFIYAHGYTFNIFDRLYVAESSYHELCFAHFNKLTANVVVAAFERHTHFR